MRIGFNARYLYDPGLRGFNRYTFCLLRALTEVTDAELFLLTEERYPVHELYRSALRAEVRNFPGSLTLQWEQWVLPRGIRSLDLDLFHAPAEGGLPLRRVCPYVVTYHGVPDKSLALLVGSGELPGTLEDYLDVRPEKQTLASKAVHAIKRRLLSKAYLNAADLVVTVSEFSKGELVRFMGIAPQKVRVIYEAAADIFAQQLSEREVERIRAKYSLPARFVLFVGGFDKRKNVSTLLKAFIQVKKEDPSLALVLVGIGGDIGRCRAAATSAGLQDGHDVYFLLRLPDSELAALYRAASLFATLSWHEGFCLPIVEAMSSGTPILASCFGAIPEILGGAGWLVDPRRLDEVVAGMRTILSEVQIREDLKARARERSQFFSWQRAARETLAAYHEVL